MRAGIQRGLAGMRPELYQWMLRDISAQLRFADDLGYHSVSFTAHRFRIEDSEVSNTRFCSIFTLRCRAHPGRPTRYRLPHA
jgi:hypothetical protein